MYHSHAFAIRILDQYEGGILLHPFILSIVKQLKYEKFSSTSE